MDDRDLDAANTKDEPERIRPSPLENVALEGERLRALLPPASWHVIRLAPAGYLRDPDGRRALLGRRGVWALRQASVRATGAQGSSREDAGRSGSPRRSGWPRVAQLSAAGRSLAQGFPGSHGPAKLFVNENWLTLG